MTVNLQAALVKLRSEILLRVLWIDVICIDQTNIQELGHQVSRMRMVYQNADEILVWLGKADEHSDAAIEITKSFEIYHCAHREEMIKHPAGYPNLVSNVCGDSISFDVFGGKGFYAGSFKHCMAQATAAKGKLALRALFTSRSWWTRIWVLQEFAVAKPESCFICSKRSVRSGTFDRFGKHLNDLSNKAFHDLLEVPDLQRTISYIWDCRQSF